MIIRSNLAISAVPIRLTLYPTFLNRGMRRMAPIFKQIIRQMANYVDEFVYLCI